MIRNVFTLFLGLIILLLFACEEKTGPLDNNVEPFAITPFSVAARINISRAKVYSAAYKVTHPDGGKAIKSVTAFLLSANNDTLLTLQLLDDGGVENPDGKDVLANDNIYTNTFISDSTVIPAGEVFIQARAMDAANQLKKAEPVTALAGFNKAPVIVSTSAPDTLPSGSPPLLLAATVQDSNGIDDVPSVLMRLKKQGNTIFTYELPLLSAAAVDSGQFGAFFDSTFAAERIGNYELEFQAEDLSEDLSIPVTKQIFLENTSPKLGNQNLPDTMIVPTSGFNTKLITIKANDSQSLSDIDSVYFNSFLPNGNPSNSNPFLLYDNGLPYNPNGSKSEAGDLVAGDGIFSLTIALPPGTPTGTYIFKFFARDKVNNFTTGPVDSIIVIQ